MRAASILYFKFLIFIGSYSVMRSSDVSKLSDHFPDVHLKFGDGQMVSLAPENYLFKVLLRFWAELSFAGSLDTQIDKNVFRSY